MQMRRQMMETQRSARPATRQSTSSVGPAPGEQTPRDLDLTFLQNPGAPGDTAAVPKSNLAPYTDWEPVYSPDGLTIVFSSNRPLTTGAASTGYNLWTMQSDGSYQQALVGTVGTDQEWPSFSPDGSRITYSSRDAQGVAQVHVVTLGGAYAAGVDAQLTNGSADSTHPSWSHADLIAYQNVATSANNPNGLSKIWVVSSANPANFYQVTGIGTWDSVNANAVDTEPAWEPSGLHVAFTRQINGQSRIWLIANIAVVNDPAAPLAVSGVQQLTDFVTPGGTPSQDQDPAWRPEGSNFSNNTTTNPDNDAIVFSSNRKSSPDPKQAEVGATSIGTTFGIYKMPITYTDATQLTVLSESAEIAAGSAPAVVVAEDTQNAPYQYDNILPTWSPAIQIDPLTDVSLPANAIGYASNSGLSYSTSTTQYTSPLTIYDIWRSEPNDVQPPSLLSLPTVTPQQSSPGQTVTIKAQFQDLGSGIDHIYVQIKDPNSYLQDVSLPPVRSSTFDTTNFYWQELILDGHRIYYVPEVLGPKSDVEHCIQGHYQEIGYQPINPLTFSYADTGVENIPFDIDFFGPVSESFGTMSNPDMVIPDTLEMQPSTDATDPAGTYTVTWVTDTHATDYYLDFIAIDNVGNVMDYDNVAGFTTAPFTSIGNQNNHILLVDDYMSPQRFLTARGSGVNGLLFGAESYWTDNPVGKQSPLDPGYIPPTTTGGTITLDALGLVDQSTEDNKDVEDQNSLIGPIANTLGPGSLVGWYENCDSATLGYTQDWVVGPEPIIGMFSTPPDPSPDFLSLVDETTVDLSGNLDGYDIWRILCRGAVPATVLDVYGPSTVSQPSATDINTVVPVKVWKSCVVWGSPFTNDEYAGAGTILDVATEQTIENFLTTGGHVMLSGQDVGWALAQGSATTSSFSATFLSTYFGVQFATDSGPFVRNSGAGPIGSRWNPSLGGLMLNQYLLVGDVDYRDNSQVGSSPNQSFPDTMTVIAPGVAEDDQGAASVYNTTTGSKTVYLPYGLEGVSEDLHAEPDAVIKDPTIVGGKTFKMYSPRNIRATLMHGIVCWMRDCSVTGQVNELEPGGVVTPAANALVQALSGATVLASTLTDSTGSYRLDGIPSGYHTTKVVWNYFGTTVASQYQTTWPVFSETRQEGANAVTLQSTLPGFAISHTTTVGLGHGGENVEANNPQTLTNGAQLLNALEPGTITGTITDASTNAPIAGATVTLINIPFTNISLTTTTNASGVYTFNNVPATPPAPATGTPTSSYVLTFSAPGYTTQTAGLATGSSYPNAILMTTQQTVTISAALVIEGGSITGTVTDGTNPVADATVTATPTVLTTGAVTATTNTMGQFTFTNLAPDTYTLVASLTGRTSSAAVKETVQAAGAVAGVVLVLGPAVVAVGTDSIAGVVQITAGGTTTPVSGATVELLNSAGTTILASTTTGTNGSYSFTSLVDGSYLVETLAATSSSVAPIAVTLSQATNGGVATGIDFTLSAAFTFPQGVSMASVPYDYSSGAGDAATIFGTSFVATYNGTSYLLYPNLPGDGKSVTPGRAYWIEESAPMIFTKPGTPPASPFNLTLSAGWNMIGNPFSATVDWNLLLFSVPVPVGSVAANTLMSLQTALVDGVVLAPMWGYSQIGGSSGGAGYVQSTSIVPFNGYWLYLNPAVVGTQPVTVQFNNPNL